MTPLLALLQDAARAARARDHEATLTALLAAYQRRPAKEIADLIDAVSGRAAEGVPRAALLRQGKRSDLVAVVGAEEWATVHELSTRSTLEPELVAHEIMRSLEVVRSLSLHDGVALLEQDSPRAWKTLALIHAPHGAGPVPPIAEREQRIIGEAHMLPALRESRWISRTSAREHRWLLRSAVASRLLILVDTPHQRFW